jgi:hypothetical protein
MRRHHRAIALAIALAVPMLASAQSGTPPSPSKDLMGRNAPGESFIRPFDRNAFGQGGLDNTGIGGPNPQRASQITPVPEPSQWALMLAGLALVGFIARRSSRSSRDDA